MSPDTGKIRTKWNTHATNGNVNEMTIQQTVSSVLKDQHKLPFGVAILLLGIFLKGMTNVT
jgi:hypothetical protein